MAGRAGVGCVSHVSRPPRTHRLWPGEIPAAGPLARHQPPPDRDEGLQHELRVLPVRLDARRAPDGAPRHGLADPGAGRGGRHGAAHTAATDEEIIDRITVAGHGEPTLHPEFEEIVDRLRAVRDRLAPGIRTAILSNSTTAGWPDVQRALGRLDERYMKLDAGDTITYARINGPGPSVTAIVDALAELPGVAIQAMFVTDGVGRVDNTTERAVADWLAAVGRVKPTGVHIYTIDRQPAAEYLRPAPRRRLREIAEHVRAAGFRADVFPAGAA